MNTTPLHGDGGTTPRTRTGIRMRIRVCTGACSPAAGVRGGPGAAEYGGRGSLPLPGRQDTAW